MNRATAGVILGCLAVSQAWGADDKTATGSIVLDGLLLLVACVVGAGVVGAGMALNRDESAREYFIGGAAFGFVAWLSIVIKSCFF